MTAKEFLDRFDALAKSLIDECCILRVCKSESIFEETAEFNIKVCLRKPTLVECKMCSGTKGFHTAEGSDMELVWHPCRYCEGKGTIKEI